MTDNQMKPTFIQSTTLPTGHKVSRLNEDKKFVYGESKGTTISDCVEYNLLRLPW